jgi:hypothetical protein
MRSSVRARTMVAPIAILLSTVPLIAAPAFASETITYVYDAKGRLVTVSHSGTANSGVSASYGYDNADNRTNVTVSTGGVCAGVSFSVSSNAAVTEGTNSVFTVTKTGTASGSCNVNYATANGTAIAPGDYTAKSGTLTFTSAQTSQTVSVTTIDDTTVESAETFAMSLSAPTNGAALGSPSNATATINDNDTAPTCGGVSFTIASNGAVTEGASSVFTVTKSGTTSNSCSVNYATAAGTASAGSDYTTKSGTLTFTSAQTSQTVTVVTIDDAVVESAETFSTALSAPTGGSTLGTPSSATATINDNDGANHPPVAGTDNVSLTCNSGTGYNLFTNDSDPDGDPLTLTSVTSNGGFTITIGNASLGIAGISVNVAGSYTGSYVVSDGRGGNTTGAINVTVTHGGPGGC